LGQRVVDSESLFVAMDKGRTRTHLAHLDTSPAFEIVTDEDQLVGAVRRLGLPVVVKPVDETSSTDVALAYSETEALGVFRQIRRISHNRKGFARPSGVLVEEYLSGPEFSVETFTKAGVTSAYGVTRKTPLAANPFVEQADSFPYEESAVQMALVRAATDAVDSLRGFAGAAHTEIRMTSSGPRIIELNARQGGGHLPSMIELVTGRNVFLEVAQMYIDTLEITSPTSRVGGVTWWQFYTEVDPEQLLELGRDEGVIVQVFGNTKTRESAHGPPTNHDCLGSVLVPGENIEQTFEIARRIARKAVET
jgi:biotin carboxylase